MTGLDISAAPAPDAAEIALADSLERAAEFATHSIVASTRRAYESDWSRFAAWAADQGVAPLPAAPAACIAPWRLMSGWPRGVAAVPKVDGAPYA